MLVLLDQADHAIGYPRLRCQFALRQSKLAAQHLQPAPDVGRLIGPILLANSCVLGVDVTCSHV